MGKASKLFFSTDNERETLYSRIVPTEDHTAFLQENWNKLAEFLRHELQEISGFPIRTIIKVPDTFSTFSTCVIDGVDLYTGMIRGSVARWWPSR